MSGRLPASQWVLRALVATMPVLAVLATAGAGEAPAPWFVVLVAVLSLGFAVFPESAVGTAVLVLVLAWWGVGLRDGLDWWAVPAAAAILTSHLAALIAAYGPPELPVAPAVASLWVRRSLVLLVPAPVLMSTATWLQGSPEPGGVWALGLAAAVVAITTGSVTYARLRGVDA